MTLISKLTDTCSCNVYLIQIHTFDRHAHPSGTPASLIVPFAGATLKQFHLVVQALQLAQAINPKNTEVPVPTAAESQ